MRSCVSVLSLLAGTTFLISGALAQQPSIVGADVTVLLSDPAGGDPWTITDTYSITYAGVTSCEAQIPNIQADYTRRVSGVELLTPSGFPPVVEVEVTCVQRR